MALFVPYSYEIDQVAKAQDHSSLACDSNALKRADTPPITIEPTQFELGEVEFSRKSSLVHGKYHSLDEQDEYLDIFSSTLSEQAVGVMEGLETLTKASRGFYR
jgi:hypothetical protein